MKVNGDLVCQALKLLERLSMNTYINFSLFPTQMLLSFTVNLNKWAKLANSVTCYSQTKIISPLMAVMVTPQNNLSNRNPSPV